MVSPRKASSALSLIPEEEGKMNNKLVEEILKS